MEFKSQVCTNIDQSERLIALGLKKETADMMLVRDFCYLTNEPYRVTIWTPSIISAHNNFQEFIDSMTTTLRGISKQFISEGYKPAWSLDRLLEIANSNDVHNFIGGNRYDDVIALIQSYIHLGYINEEYLNMNIVKARENMNIELLTK